MTVAHSVIDVHAHIGRTITSDVGQTVDEWIAEMAASGVTRSVISVAAGGLQTEGIIDTRRANDAVAAAVVAHPGLFLAGLGSVEVRHGLAGVAEARRAIDELGLKGLAFHATFEGFTVRSAAFSAVLDAVASTPALILLHSTPDPKASPSAIAQVAADYPLLTFVMGHPLFTEDQRSQAVRAVTATPNLHVDIAYQADPAVTEYFVREVGASRVLFGSDAPFFSARDVIRSVEQAEISDDDRAAIFSGNAEALLASL
ncbi:amidohydrolase family protein [Yonghaparkia sp. Soil809]|uniref:amidohydrolase family protein n=1 Tax=Yonghaparkia sp. Soil809 TaxID=1736417 RepID=UPI0009E916AF|nr:amidohydrolase family protein [Yonghaparkia sp. Soil809]